MTATMREAIDRSLDYVREGVKPEEAVRRAVADMSRERSIGLGDFSEGWDTFTTYAPWIAAGIVGFFVYRGAVKTKRAVSDYIDQKRRKFTAAKAVWDATI